MSKEEIYTIPIIDAFKTDCECPFCHLYESLEKDSIDFVLGPSYMDVDIRHHTNASGFCANHYAKLFNEKNRLGMALILETHMKKVRQDLEAAVMKPYKSKSFHIGKRTVLSPVKDFTEKMVHQCYICDRVEDFLDHYLDTFFYLWKKDTSFRDLFMVSKGFCIRHFGHLYDRGEYVLKDKDFQAFKTNLIAIQQSNFDRVIGDLEWFISKFDYRYEKEPWKQSKDAVSRSIQKISDFKP
ncbi:DUF6062 family protein [Petrocella sp. FN5]|uniref:DUF6062 family protein n=1 Tax=Petrocella sp. FN5 TaxID=3032002 RepID=UPI0023D9CD0A|nr:DUF6062 family protein [Petrocella sp. FN5]MDF1616690.1 DUF6062 family protein [Petrocella sp. FN5]